MSVRRCHNPPLSIIEPLLERPPSTQERVFRRRRLGLLVGLFLAVLAMAPLLARVGTDVQTVAAGDVVAADAGEPVTLSGVIAETTSTMYTPKTAPPTTPPITAAPTTALPTTQAPSITVAPATAPATTQAPSTTAAPATAAPTTAAPTTAAPATTSSGGDYAYDDPRSTRVWYDLANCEAGGNWSINTGNGYYGGLQFSLSSWQSVGGSGYPHHHSAATQIEMGRRLQARQGWAAWPHCSSELGLR